MHICKLEGDGLVVAYFGAKSFAHLGIFTGKIVSSRGNPQGLCRYTYSSAGKCFHCEFKAEAVFANSVFLWNFYVIKNQGMGIAPTDTKLVFLWTNFKTFPAFFNYKRVDALVFFLLIGLRDSQIIIGRSAIGYPIFGAVQNVVVAFVNGSCFL